MHFSKIDLPAHCVLSDNAFSDSAMAMVVLVFANIVHVMYSQVIACVLGFTLHEDLSKYVYFSSLSSGLAIIDLGS